VEDMWEILSQRFCDQVKLCCKNYIKWHYVPASRNSFSK